MFFGRSEEHQKFVAEVKLNWDSTEQSPQNQIGAPDQLYSELNLRPPDCNRTTPNVDASNLIHVILLNSISGRCPCPLILTIVASARLTKS